MSPTASAISVVILTCCVEGAIVVLAMLRSAAEADRLRDRLLRKRLVP